VKTVDYQAEIDRLELQRTALHNQIEAFVIPCPDCKADVKGIKTDTNGNAECPKCCAAITREDVQSFLDESNVLWQRLCATSSAISVLRTRKFVHELYQGLKPWRKFLTEGCKRKSFTPALYKMLSHTFRNIAHMDEGGFWNVQFSDRKTAIDTLVRMAAHVAAHPAESVPLLNGHGRLYVRLEKKIFGKHEKEVLELLQLQQEKSDENAERAEYERLRKKFLDTPSKIVLTMGPPHLTDSDCHAASDGDFCHWVKCPQLRDGEPKATGRHCPLDTYDPDDEGKAGG
jgi:hypothetical protein